MNDDFYSTMTTFNVDELRAIGNWLNDRLDSDGDRVLEAANEIERLNEILWAIFREGSTTWPDATCGRGEVGAQVITTVWHEAAIQVLLNVGLSGGTLQHAAEAYQTLWPDARRLDQPAKQYNRAGPDGRPT